jgi:hypothetical protein
VGFFLDDCGCFDLRVHGVSGDDRFGIEVGGAQQSKGSYRVSRGRSAKKTDRLAAQEGQTPRFLQQNAVEG